VPEAALQFRLVEFPMIILVEEIINLFGPVKFYCGAVERVLRYGDHVTVVLLVGQEREHGLHALGGAVGKKYAVGVRGNAVAARYEFRHRLTYERNTGALRIGAGACGVLLQYHLCAPHDIRGEYPDGGGVLHARGARVDAAEEDRLTGERLTEIRKEESEAVRLPVPPDEFSSWFEES